MTQPVNPCTYSNIHVGHLVNHVLSGRETVYKKNQVFHSQHGMHSVGETADMQKVIYDDNAKIVRIK